MVLVFSEREYKISMANMFKDIKEDTENMLKEEETIRNDEDDLKRKQTELLEIKKYSN